MEEKTKLPSIFKLLIMVKFFWFFIIFIFFQTVFAQDIDIYKHQKNSNFQWPSIPKEMTFEEFEILSANLRMQDMLIAVVLPGHIHFKIKEPKKAYSILGARSLGYAGWIYLSKTNNSLINIILLNQLDLQLASNFETFIAYGSIFLIVGSYLYDWIHGRYVLDKKQNKIRYKYSKKISLNLSNIKINNNFYPGFTLAYNFK